MTVTEPTSEALDVFGSLPENVLSRIIECLPLRDAARTSMLSKAWRCTWLSIPKLTFDAQFFEDVLKEKRFDAAQIYAVVSVVLLYHVGPVTKFELYVPNLKTTMCFIAPFLSYLSKNGVREITIRNAHQGRINLASYLFSCGDLEKLQLNHCTVDLPSSFKGFRNITYLEVDGVLFKGNSFRRLVECCPQLETLTLLKWIGCKGVYIHAPNIKCLTLSGKFESLWLKVPQNLVSLSVTLDEMVQNYRLSRLQELIKLLYESSNLEKLFLGGYTCKLLSAGGIVPMLPFKFKWLKVLEFSNIEANDEFEFRCVVGMIRSCSVIEVLKISFSSVISAEYDIDDAMFCSLGRLCEVKVAGVQGFSMELKLIEFLLTHSSTLPKFYVERSSNVDANLESEMTRQLMRFRRASPRAEVIYVDPKS